MRSYVLLAVILVVARVLVRWLGPRPPARPVEAADYPVLAHLAGGRKRVALAAAAAARVARAVDVLPQGDLFRFRPLPPLSDVEAVVAGAFGRDRRWRQARDATEVRWAARRVADRATAAGLTGALRPVPAHTLAVAATVLAALVLRPEPWWALIALVPAYLLLVRPTRRSIAGEQAVRAARAARPDLHPWQQASWRGVTPADAGLTVALYGATALRAIDGTFARRLFGDPLPRNLRPRRQTEATADTGCGGSCGDGGE